MERHLMLGLLSIMVGNWLHNGCYVAAELEEGFLAAALQAGSVLMGP
jgi:hypothetical protein